MIPRWGKISLAVIGGFAVGWAVIGFPDFMPLLFAIISGAVIAKRTRHSNTSWAKDAGPSPNLHAQQGPTRQVEDDIRLFLREALSSAIIDTETFSALSKALGAEVARNPTPDPVSADAPSLIRELHEVTRRIHALEPLTTEWRELVDRHRMLMRNATEAGIDVDNAPNFARSRVRPTSTPSISSSTHAVIASPIDSTPGSGHIENEHGPLIRADPSAENWILKSLHRIWRTLVSEFAVHSFAYIGVFFVFVGILGFVIFAFAAVELGYRPIAEFVIPIFLFGSAYFLRRRGAPFVANALTLLGGGVTPIAAFAALNDGASFPPDLTGKALVGTLTVVSLALAVAYGFAARVIPGSSIRYLAAPMVWTAAGVLGLIVDHEPSMSQMTIVTATIVTVAVIARKLASQDLSKPTLAITAPGLVVGYVLVILFGWSSGWPPIPTLAAGLTGIAAAEMLPGTIGMAWLVESLAIAATALAIGVTWGLAPVSIGITISFIVLAEVWRSRERHSGVLSLMIIGGTAGVALAANDAGLLLAGSLFFGVWSHFRHVLPIDTPTKNPIIAVASAMPVVAVVALAQLTNQSIALTVAGTALLAASFSTRLRRSADRFYQTALPIGAGLTIAAALTIDTYQSLTRNNLGMLAVGVGSASLVLAQSIPWRGIRVWISATGFLWAALLALRSWGLNSDAQVAIIAVAGALAVSASITWGTREAGHLAAMGHLWTIGAMAYSGTEATQFISLSSWTGAWIAQSVAHEWRRSPLTALCQSWVVNTQRLRAFIPAVAPLLAMISLPFSLIAIADVTGLLAGERGRIGLLLAANAVGYGALARLATGRHLIAPYLVSGGVILSGVATAIAAPEPWPAIVTVTSTIAVVVIIGETFRKPILTWLAWAASFLLALLLGDRMGVPGGDLHLILLGWSAVLLVGSLALDDSRAGRRQPGEGIRTGALVPPIALAAVAIPLALAFQLSNRASDAWPTMLAAGVLYLIVSVQLRAGAASGVAHSLIAFSAALALIGTRFDPVLAPWVLTIFAAMLLVISWLLERLTSDRNPWTGWSTAPLVTAHGVAAIALMLGADGHIPTTFLGVGGLSLLIALWKRRWEWGTAGVVAALIGTAGLGHGWFAVGLSLAAIGHQLVALRFTGVARRITQIFAVGLGGWAWSELILWVEWSVTTDRVVTAGVSSVIAMAIAIAIRRRQPLTKWLLPWAALAAVGTLTATVANGGSRLPVGIGLAAAFTLWSSATAMSAAPLRMRWLREAAALLALAAGTELGFATQSTAAQQIFGTVGSGAIAAGLSVGVWVRRTQSAWIRPLLTYATIAHITAIIIALSQLPERPFLVAALAAAAIECMVLGLMFRNPGFLYVGLPMLLGAWVTFASESLSGNAQWFTIPIGLIILAVVEVARWDITHRTHRATPHTVDAIFVAEIVGIGFLVGPSLFQTITTSQIFGLTAMLLGVGVILWGITTRLRRRAYVGAGVIVLAGLLIVLVPIARAMTQFRGVALWATFAGIGVVMLVIAVTLERGKALAQSAVGRIEELTKGWE